MLYATDAWLAFRLWTKRVVIRHLAWRLPKVLPVLVRAAKSSAYTASGRFAEERNDMIPISTKSISLVGVLRKKLQAPRFCRIIWRSCLFLSALSRGISTPRSLSIFSVGKIFDKKCALILCIYGDLDEMSFFLISIINCHTRQQTGNKTYTFKDIFSRPISSFLSIRGFPRWLGQLGDKLGSA